MRASPRTRFIPAAAAAMVVVLLAVQPGASTGWKASAALGANDVRGGLVAGGTVFHLPEASTFSELVTLLANTLHVKVQKVRWIDVGGSQISVRDDRDLEEAIAVTVKVGSSSNLIRFVVVPRDDGVAATHSKYELPPPPPPPPLRTVTPTSTNYKGGTDCAVDAIPRKCCGPNATLTGGHWCACMPEHGCDAVRTCEPVRMCDRMVAFHINVPRRCTL
jgi:hypothetical protein